MTATTADYLKFLTSKVKVAKTGSNLFEGVPTLQPSAKPHQRDIITCALRRERMLIACRFGLGKTHIQAELARLIHEQTGQPFLTVVPLGAKHQFQEEDGPRLGLDYQYVRTDAEVRAATSPYLITNYERVRDGSIDPRLHNFAGISLDEGSVLRSLGAKTPDIFRTVFADVPYKYVCTATPSPNNYREIIYYADWLGIQDRGKTLTEFFQRNPDKAGDLTLMPHREREFWLWVATWAIFLYAPSDLGYSDEGYDLPPLKVTWHRVEANYEQAWEYMDNRGQHRLIADVTASMPMQAREKRESIPARLAKTMEIMATAPDDHWIIWHDLEAERKALEKAMPEATTVYGSQSLEEREERIIGFTRGEFRVLATKPRIAGSGCNFQRHCHHAIYMGVTTKFQDFIQSVHRLQRYQQLHPVEIHIVYAETEEPVVNILKQKWAQHEELTIKMQNIIKEYGLSRTAIELDLARTLGITRYEVRGNRFKAINNDCVLELMAMESNSIGLLHTSIPFGNHYEYTTNLEDFGHNEDDGKFWEQMDFLIPELLRVLKPGRVAAIHVKDRVLYGHQTQSGIMEISPFSDECVMAFRKHGFLYEGRRTIVTDVVRENNSSNRLGWTEMTKDASKMGCGLHEYELVFRKAPTTTKNARADEPVTKSKTDYTRARWQIDAHALWRSNGNRHLTPKEMAQLTPQDAAAIYEAEQLNTPYDHERHVAICEEMDKKGYLPSSWMLLPPKVTQGAEGMVWDDIFYMNTLNSQQSRKRQESHICPLPLDIVERTIRLYSNPGDTVLDPFAGLHTVPYMAIKLEREAIGIELNPIYYKFGVRYCQDMEIKAMTPTLFDLLEAEEETEVEELTVE